MNYKYITDFHKSRENKIGASDIIWTIPHPEIQIESLAAWSEKGKRHPCTALDLYNEKINPTPSDYGFPAEMGHFLEVKAIYEFIKDNIDNQVAFEFKRGYDLHKLETELQRNKTGKSVCINPEPYNNTPFKHNTEAVSDYGVAHSDCVYVPRYKDTVIECPKCESKDLYNYGEKNPCTSGCGQIIDATKIRIIKKNGLKIDLSKPFGIEAKSARFHTVNARKKDKYKGYDLDLKTWQGVPLKVYFQAQFQMVLYGYDVTYLALIFDTSAKHYWTIKANKKHQRELIQIAKYMKQCIDSKTPPKNLIMNSRDIAKLYPEIKEDFREVKKDELEEILQVAVDFRKASTQEKEWKKKKVDAEERMSVHLKDTGMIKGVVGGSLQTIAKWKETGGSERLMGLKDIKEREDSKKLLKYFDKNELIKVGAKNRKPSVVIKEKDMEVE